MFKWKLKLSDGSWVNATTLKNERSHAIKQVQRVAEERGCFVVECVLWCEE